MTITVYREISDESDNTGNASFGLRSIRRSEAILIIASWIDGRWINIHQRSAESFFHVRDSCGVASINKCYLLNFQHCAFFISHRAERKFRPASSQNGKAPRKGRAGGRSDICLQFEHGQASPSIQKGAKGGFTVRSVPRQESGRVLSVLGPGERRLGAAGEGWWFRARSRDRGFVIEACYSATGLLSAGGRLPQAEKSRDPAARSPPPQVYDAAEGDRDNDACGAAARYKNSSGREFTRESAVTNMPTGAQPVTKVRFH